MEGATDTSETPVHTNPSYLTETDLGRDLHHQSSSHDTDRQNATFADMARVGLGGQLRPDHMASHEPIPLTSYIKFKKPRRRGAHSPFEDEIADKAPTPGPSMNAQYSNQAPTSKSLAQAAYSERRLRRKVVGAHLMPANAAFMQNSVHPIDALGAHFAVVRQTFGRELCTPGQLEGVLGQRDGEVQFSIDGGGDITAHSWSANQIQWLKVGHYIYRRKAIEGALGVRQLKGQKIGGAVPRNQIEHFYALAKQYEEDSANSLSPVAFDTGSSRFQQQQAAPPTTVPLQSPRPQRPSATFKIDGDFSGSLSSVGYPSQQTGLPTLATFASANQATAALQQSLSKMSSDQASVYSMPPPSTSMRESQTSSPTNPHGVSPLSHRYPLSTAATTFDQEGASNNSYAPKLEQPSTRLGNPNNVPDYTKEWYTNLREEEVQRLQQRATPVEAPRHPIYGDDDAVRSNRYMMATFGSCGPQGSNSPVQCFTSNGQSFGKNHQNIFNQMSWNRLSELSAPTQTQPKTQTLAQGQQQLRMQPSQAYLPTRPWPTTEVASPERSTQTGDDFSWTSLGKGHLLEISKPNPPPSEEYPRKAYGPLVDTPPHRNISGLGGTEGEYEATRRPVWRSTMDDQESDSEDGREFSPSKALPLRNKPYLRAPPLDANADSDGESDIDFVAQVDRLVEDVVSATEVRTDFLREKARTLRDKSGRPLSEDRLEELANDPLSHLMWGVKLNLKSYRDARSSQDQGAYYPEGAKAVPGDYFQRQWTVPNRELIDNRNPSAKTSFFSESGLGSDEVVVFKGRGSAASLASANKLGAVGERSARRAPVVPAAAGTGASGSGNTYTPRAYPIVSGSMPATVASLAARPSSARLGNLGRNADRGGMEWRQQQQPTTPYGYGGFSNASWRRS